ncbi:hypothetical protein JTE90_001668 [Oedothorax gibbosus]|uniref:Uncharacterized protein n=1 Tax=Oedothorax gibbosus TaxID=931172 RepID=A0AAV6UX44_9ARAC|nr:hypothetical protein JTE90_001668 [Oedothorax gibbosus]
MHLEVFLLLTAALTVSSRIVCTPDFCDKIQCTPDLSCGPNQELDPHGSFCGCCPACITIIEKGQTCHPSIFVGGPPPTEKCRDGICDPKTRKCT